MTKQLATVVLAAGLLSGGALASEVSFAVDKNGLKWTGNCEATFFAPDDDDELRTSIDLELPVDIADGTYDVVVSCPSTEGTLKQTFRTQVRGATTVKANMVPAFLVTTVVRAGTEVPGKITVEDRWGRTVAKGKDKEPLPVPVGNLVVKAKVSKKHAGGRKPVRGEVTIATRAMKKVTPTIDVSDGRLFVDLMANGRRVGGVAGLVRKKDGKQVIEVEAGSEQTVPPGDYNLVTQLYESHDLASVTTPNVSVRPGKLRRVKISHRVGFVTPQVVLDGKLLTAGEKKLEIELFKQGEEKSFNAIAPGETATLGPGTFLIKAKHKGKRLDDRTRMAAETTVKVSAGRQLKPRIDISPAHLNVNTQIGREAKSLVVKMWREGAQTHVAKRRSRDDGVASFSVRPGRYKVTAELEAPQGTLTAETSVNLRAGKTVTQEMSIDVGTASVQVFDKGVAVPAEVMFFREGAAEAALKVKAGQDAYLPPGNYAITVKRLGKERSFAPIRIAPGRTAERKLELTIEKAQEKKEGKAEGKKAADKKTPMKKKPAGKKPPTKKK